MRCPFCGGTFQLQGPFCPLCGRRIIGPDTGELAPEAPASPQPVAPAPPPGPFDYSGDVLVVDVEPEPAPRIPRAVPPAPGMPVAAPPVAVQSVRVDQEHAGKTCPYCRFPLKVNEQMTICPACRVAHHADCWQENGGCTTYACRLSPESRPPEAAAAGPVIASQGPTAPAPPPYVSPHGPLLPPDRVAAVARLEADATTALTLSLLGLFCFGILSLVGVGMGVWVLARMKALGVHAPGASGRAIAAIIIGVGVLLAMVLWGYAVSGSGGGTGL